MASNIRKMTVNPRSSKYMYISKLNRKTCMKNGIESIVHINMRQNMATCDKNTKHAINISMDKTCCINLDYGFMGLIRGGDNPNKETLIYIPHIRCHHHLNSYNLSCHQGDRTRVCLKLSWYHRGLVL